MSGIKKAPQKKTINLALQGGGSHGAFTWGVLDAILEDGRFDIEGISATSAGAMNAAVLAYGKQIGGNKGAREALDLFWRKVSESGAFYRSFYQNPISRYLNLQDNPLVNMAEELLGTLSPYQFNPLNINPLKDILEEIIDFKDIHVCECIKLFITATNVRTGNARVFQNEEVTLDVLLAASCLPHVFQATEIDGEAYWDGGYMGNPSLWPLFYHAHCRNILLVHINPITRPGIPKTIVEIENRLNEITFNSALLKELRAIDFVKKLLHEDMLRGEHQSKYKDILLYAIRTEDDLSALSAASKSNTDWSFLLELKDKGRTAAKKWLKAHYKDVGKKSSVDITKDYLSL